MRREKCDDGQVGGASAEESDSGGEHDEISVAALNVRQRKKMIDTSCFICI